MSLSRKQQGMFRPLVDRAWSAWCAAYARAEGAVDPLPARDAWYRDQLEEAIGVRSTKNLDPGDDFARLMAHFERVADDGETYWQERAAEEDERRLRWHLDQRIAKGTISDGYVASISERMFRTRQWRDLPADHLRRILIALDKHQKRRRA